MVACARVRPVLGVIVLLVSTPTRAAPEPDLRGTGKTLTYLKGVHERVHSDWALNFLAMAEAQLPKDDPINSPLREVTLEVTLAPKGALLDTRVLKSSSVPGFDTSAIDVVKNTSTFPLAPEEVISDDGKVHLYWVFARDHRQCSGITVAHKEAPLPQAMAALVRQGRDSTALGRLAQAESAERPVGFSAFAKAWLARQTTDSPFGVTALVALARAGEGEAGVRLAKVANTAPEAAEGLAALAIPGCPLVKDELAKATPASRKAALHVLRHGTGGECLSFLEGVAKDKQAPVEDRVMAIEGLGKSEGPASLQTLRALAKEGPPPVVAAAILAEARPDAGKGAVFRLLPKLRAPALPVRAAAAAAMVRVGGETGLAQLFMMFREKDPGLYQGVAVELGRLAGKESAAMLTKFLRKSTPRIRLAGARALAQRTDEYAQKALAELREDQDPEIRALARSAQAEAPVSFPLTPDTRPTFQVLAAGKGRDTACQILLDQFAALEPGLRIALLGDWLATTPARN